MSRKWYSIENKAKDGEAEIRIFDSIGKSFWNDDTVSAKGFVEDLDKILADEPTAIHVYINSPGGDVFEGMTIYNALARVRDKVVIHIEGWAASIASVIALAGHRVEMASTGLLMIHDPTTLTWGSEADHTKAIELLSRVKASILGVYMGRTDKPEDDVAKAMTDETWLTADEAVEWGFVDSITNLAPVTAHYDGHAWGALYRHAPLLAHNENGGPPSKGANDMSDNLSAPTPATFAELKAGLPGSDATFRETQMEASATMAQAQTAWMAEQSRQLEEAKVESKKIADENEKLRKKSADGVDGLGDGANGDGDGDSFDDPTAEWEKRVQALVAQGKTKQQATMIMAREAPELREAHVVAYNIKFKNARNKA